MSDKATLPPHSIEAEEAVLGSLLIDPDAMLDVHDFLRPNHFYNHRNRVLYTAACQLTDDGVPIDLITLHDYGRRKLPDDDGLESYIIGLIGAVPTALNVEYYGRIVQETAVRRGLIQAAGAIAGAAYDGDLTLSEAVAQSEKLLQEASEEAVTDVVPVSSLLSDFIDQTMARVRAGGVDVPGVATGLVDLDRLIGGLPIGYLTILAARPGMGKSMLERTIAAHAAGSGLVVAEFNLEMPAEALIRRHVAGLSGLAYDDIERGKLDEGQATRFMSAVGQMSEWRLYIDDTPSLTISQLRAKCRRLKARHGLDLVTVDYVQLMTPDRSRGNREQEIGEISRGLVVLAKELRVPVLALAQLNRGVESRGDKKPLLSDLRESGTLEQDASVVMFIYRDEYYNKDTTARPNIADIDTAKNRYGKAGEVSLYFNGRTASFRNLQREALNL